jgi:hypothetical protein
LTAVVSATLDVLPSWPKRRAVLVSNSKFVCLKLTKQLQQHQQLPLQQLLLLQLRHLAAAPVAVLLVRVVAVAQAVAAHHHARLAHAASLTRK